MKRWVWFSLCGLLGLLLLLCGWLIPVHLRAIESPVLAQAGRNSASVIGRGVSLVHIGQYGPGEMMLRAAQRAKFSDTNELVSALDAEGKKAPALKLWGAQPGLLRNYFPRNPKPTDTNFTDFVVREENRAKAIDMLGKSKQPAVQALIQSRTLTNTTTFAPAQSPGGEAFDTAVVITGLLVDQNKITPELSKEIESAATQANQTGKTEGLEQILLDVLSLGQRFNWGQLVTFVGKMDGAETLHQQAELARNANDQLPDLFAAVELSGDPKAVAQYLKEFPKTGYADVTAAFPYNANGVRALVRSDHRLFTSPLRQAAARTEPLASLVAVGADYSWRTPEFALILKWSLYFAGGFLLALALHVGRRPATELEAPLQVRGFHVARELLFALGFLLVVVLVSEPFLAQQSAATAMPFRLRIPTAGSAIQPENINLKTSFMDKSRLIPMALFFVLQGLLYISSIVKLAEIQRQKVSPRVKLRLLENEDHLFDAGLYLGFLGTIIAFILSSVSQKHSFDLMVAYSSTSFGILFVSVFKIFHLRPVRRKLVMEAEAEPVVTATTNPATTTTPAPSLVS
ncbi:MAG TPA: hypothetical protein VHC44_17065 [Verrucomicrobiae bacterium]|nr:hypothetical protein [Verrucomicrobiae bacterium]